MGYAYYMAGDLDNALKSALVVYNMDMSSFSNLIHIIEIHKRRKNYEEAIMLLTKFCNNYPVNHRSYLALGELYEDMGDFNKAKDQLETASLLEPNNNDIALRLCNLETKFGNFDIAINQLITLDKDPRKTTDEKYEIYRALYHIYKKLGQIKTSIKYVEQMYELGFLWAWTKVEDAGALAWRYIEIGNIKAATIKINELKRKNVESTHGLIAQIFLADIYLFQKEY